MPRLKGGEKASAGEPTRPESRDTRTRPETALLVRDALRADKDDPDALFVLAALEVQDGHLEEGLSILDRVLVINPAYPGAWFFKEKLHRMNGEPERAKEARRKGEAREDE
jgi:cytochrome c-type biogenesis protein CcmH/NrfG